jgi:phenylalanyl-tRNA synthetase alpha subunit
MLGGRRILSGSPHLVHRCSCHLSIPRIETYFKERSAATGTPVQCFDDLFPVVPVKNNFDDLLIPRDHVSRSPIDTYYVDDQHVLRTHTRWGGESGG